VGEIVLTGGQNPFFPLLRYRTGDRAAVVSSKEGPALVQLAGRPAIVFRDGHGGLLNNVDVTAVLRPLRVAGFRLHQEAGGRVLVRLSNDDDGAAVRAALVTLFGTGVPIEIGQLADVDVLEVPLHVAHHS
jgi:phenylacetate-CoA ligase